MGKLLHKGKIILDSMRIARSTWAISKGLMFSSKKTISKGICLVMPVEKDVKFGAAVTMWFCFYKMDILFINSSYIVVDKITLSPWKLSYIPKEKCMYVIESTAGKFDTISIGDHVDLFLDRN